MDDVRDMVAKASRILGHAGHGDLIWGHASARDADDRGAWIKQSTWGMEEITPERVHLVNGQGEVVEGDGPRHSEYPIHTEIMAARPDVGGVVHTHSRFALALAATGQELRAVSHEGNFFCPPGVPRFTETADLIRTPELGKSVAEALGSAPAIFLVNHGIVCVGPDVQTATVIAILLDRACEQQLLTHQAGGWPTWSPDAESLSKRQNIYPEPALYHVWDYLLRQLS
ncbi:class II aldolase/adducin family protein [Acidothermaceae bacterium B102]|nr:class II aldolase/adducin family protein [Acidothermaceae bacterium B102]